jgi:hypothetical protein
MALSATVLADLMDSKAQAATPIANEEARAGRKRMFTAVAEAVVEHISAAAQVSGTAAVGLTSATGGPVTGAVILPPGSIT